MRLGFMGTPEFSVNTLKSLVSSGFDVAVVYCQPPRPKGRGKRITPCPVHAYANETGIEVQNPTSFKDTTDIEILKSYNLDAIVVVAYGIILPQSVLDVPKFGCFNGHASLLPRWRGAAPIQRGIEAGDKKTGVCIMKMDAGLDTGDVMSESFTDIDSDMTAGQLHDVLSDMTAEAIVPALKSVEIGTAIYTPQTEDGTCYADKLLKSESTIDWANTATNVCNRIRAFNPFPSSSMKIGDVAIKVLETSVVETDANNAVPGQVLCVKPFIIACGVGSLEIKTVQKTGKKPMTAKDLMNGFSVNLGDIVT